QRGEFTKELSSADRRGLCAVEYTGDILQKDPGLVASAAGGGEGRCGPSHTHFGDLALPPQLFEGVPDAAPGSGRLADKGGGQALEGNPDGAVQYHEGTVAIISFTDHEVP